MSAKQKIEQCQTCRRRPSERTGYGHRGQHVDSLQVYSCPNPIHDQADRIGETRAALTSCVDMIEQLAPSDLPRGVLDVVLFQARTALAPRK